MRIVGSAFLLCVTVSTAVAGQEPEVYVDIPPDFSPVTATAIDVPRAEAPHISLRVDTGARVTATSVVPYEQGPEPITIALVYSGDEIFIGNEEHEFDEAARYHGSLNALKDALEQPAFRQAFPPGSQIVVVSYDDHATVRVPLGPLADFSVGGLGREADYRNRFGRDLVSGIEQGLVELERVTTPHRALIVVGDGTHVNQELAAESLRALRRRSRIDNIAMYGVIYKTPLSDSASPLLAAIPRATTLSSTSSMSTALASIAARIGNRYYVTFPYGELPRDGQYHDVTVLVNGQPFEVGELRFPGTMTAPEDNRGWWWQLGLGTLGAALLALGAYVRARRAATPTSD